LGYVAYYALAEESYENPKICREKKSTAGSIF
jgi:hypothetical protein